MYYLYVIQRRLRGMIGEVPNKPPKYTHSSSGRERQQHLRVEPDGVLVTPRQRQTPGLHAELHPIPRTVQPGKRLTQPHHRPTALEREQYNFAFVLIIIYFIIVVFLPKISRIILYCGFL